MGGFTLYETLRILVPGVLTTLSLDFALRVGFGPKVFEADGGVNGFVELLESTAGFTAFSLTAGLLLYMIDVPVKLRIFRGEPDRDHRMPSETLREMLRGSPLERDALSLYFTLTDQYLPDEMRKRVYLFGSLYRIYVDLRVLLMTVAVATMASSEMVARADGDANPPVELSSAATACVLGIVVALGVVGGFGVRRHLIASRRSHGSSTPLLGQVAADARDVAWALIVLGVAGGLGALSLASSNWLLVASGIAGVVLQLTVWMMLEIGPPDADETDKWRDRLLHALGAHRGRAQYAAVQRLLFDLFLILPWLIGATWTNVLLDRDPATVLAWALLILPPVAVMSFRKHEERLLGIYREQTVWLEAHSEDIRMIRDSRLLPDRWEKR